MAGEQRRLNGVEPRLPAATARALRLSGKLIGWPAPFAAHMQPLVAGNFGARIVNRFHLISSPGVLAMGLAGQFIPSAGYAPAMDLPLLPYGQLQRAVGRARWRASVGLPERSGVPPIGRLPETPGPPAPEPLMSELAALGWGWPVSSVPPLPSLLQPAELAPGTAPAPAGGAVATGPAPEPAEGIPPSAHTESERPPRPAVSHAAPVLGRPALPEPGTDTPSVPAVIAATTSLARRAMPNLAPGLPQLSPAPPGNVRSAPPYGAERRHAPSEEHQAPNPAPLHPATLRRTALPRPQPPDPMRRMHMLLLVPGRDLAPPMGEARQRRLERFFAPGLPLESAPSATLSRAEGASTGAQDNQPTEPPLDAPGAPALTIDALAARHDPSRRSAAAARLPESELLSSTGAVYMPNPASAASRASPALPTLLEQRYRSGRRATGSAPLVLLRTRPWSIQPDMPQLWSSDVTSARGALGRPLGQAAARESLVGTAPDRGARDRNQGAGAPAPLDSDAGAAGIARSAVLAPSLAPVEVSFISTAEPAREAGFTRPVIAARSAAPPAAAAEWGALPLLQRIYANSLPTRFNRSLPLSRTPTPVTWSADASARPYARPGEPQRPMPAYQYPGRNAGAPYIWAQIETPLHDIPRTTEAFDDRGWPLTGNSQPVGGQPRAERFGRLDDQPSAARRLFAPARPHGIPQAPLAPPALDLFQPARGEARRAPADAPSVPAAVDAGGAAAAAAPSRDQGPIAIERIAQQVYDQIRRRLLIDRERRGGI